MKNTLLAVALAAMLLLSACTAQVDKGMMEKKSDTMMEEKAPPVMEEKETMMEKNDSATMMEKKSDSMMVKNDSDAMMEKKNYSMMEENKMMTAYSGKVLAGKASPYLEFNEADYSKAKTEGKTILLYFYASWCPTCKAEQPITMAAFDELNNPDVIGFRVKYKDGESQVEKDLAKEFGIPYQHTKVILQGSERVLKSLETWDKARYLAEIAKYS